MSKKLVRLFDQDSEYVEAVSLGANGTSARIVELSLAYYLPGLVKAVRDAGQFFHDKAAKGDPGRLNEHLAVMDISDSVKLCRIFARFVREFNHIVEHGLYSYGYVIEINKQTAASLDAAAKGVSLAFEVRQDAAESACATWCFHRFAELVSSMGAKRAAAMALAAETEFFRRQEQKEIFTELAVQDSAAPIPTAAEMVKLTDITMIKPDGWTWTGLSPYGPIQSKPRERLPKPKQKSHAEPAAPRIAPPAPVVIPPAEWPANEMEEAAKREKPEAWQTVMQCCEFIRQEGRASVQMFENRGFSYNKAKRAIAKLEELGVVGKLIGENGVYQRPILKLPATKA